MASRIWPFNLTVMNEKTKLANIYTIVNSNHEESENHHIRK